MGKESNPPSPNVTALLKRGKRNIAKLFKGECTGKFGENESLTNLLNTLLDPKAKQIDDVDTIDWCRWLIAGGSTFDEFAKLGNTIKKHLSLCCINHKMFKEV